MSDLLDKWLTDELEVRLKMGAEMKLSTAKSYRSIVMRQLIPAFGEYRSDSLDGAVQSWRKTMANRIAAGELSKKTHNNIFTLLNSIFAWARKQHYMTSDPLAGEKRIRIERSEADFLEHSDIVDILEAVTDSAEESAVIHLGLFAGLRRGEIFGLQWQDFAGARLTIRRSVYQGVVTTPKTDKSARVVDLPQNVLGALERHREASPGLSSDFVFHTRTGTPTYPDKWYRRKFSAIRERAGLRSSIGLHALRHTYASLLIDQGESPKYVSAQLGHASISITMDRYGHLFQKTSETAMSNLDQTIGRLHREAKVASRGLRVVGDSI